MNAFYVVGGLLAVWAVIVSFLGITREGFPSSKATERLVCVISVVLVAGAIGSAIYVGATEGDKETEESAQVLPG